MAETARHLRAVSPRAPESSTRTSTGNGSSAGDRWIKSFVAKRFLHATFDSYKVTPKNRDLFEAARRFVDSYTEDGDRGLLLSGNVGVGKTHLAIAIGRHLAERGVWPYFTSFVKVTAAIKQSWGVRDFSGGQMSERMIREPLLTKNLLILDDLGAEQRDKQDQGWTTELVYDIVQSRYEAMLPTVITTNLSLDAIEERYSARIASRLVQMCDAVWSDAPDYRLTAGVKGGRR